MNSVRVKAAVAAAALWAASAGATAPIDHVDNFALLLKDWEPITTWSTHHAGLPPRLVSELLDGTVRAFRGYALGLTELGVMNAAVVGIGALALGIPVAGPIALVTFIASYVPYFGAVLAGFVGIGVFGPRGSAAR